MSPSFRERCAMTLLLAGGAFLRLWNPSANGFGNVYYAAAARSGMASGRNAFFAAYDPAGFVSLDKPPVALWIQTLSATLFGYSGWAIHFPQTLAGFLAIIALWRIIRQDFGRAAGLAAALTLALTPISVAVDRSNLPDSWLVLLLILSAGAFLRAAETGRLLPLLGGAALAGIAFNVKMLAAFVPLPAFFLAYALGSPTPPRVTAARLVPVLLLLAVVSASWTVWVDLTPPVSRPYVGGSRNNSVRDLIFGYNGAGRLTGGKGQFGTGAGSVVPENAPVGLVAGGDPSGGRLFRPVSAEQVMWLFPVAFCGLILGAGHTSWRLPLDARARSLVVWGGWAGLYFGVLSASRGTYHPYYLSALAPALAALVGVMVSEARTAFREHGSRSSRIVLTATALFAALYQGFLLRPHGDAATLYITLLVVGTVIAAGAGIIAVAVTPIPRFVGAALAIGASAPLLAPLLWCIGAGEKRNSGLFPAARPPSFFHSPKTDNAAWQEPTETTDAKTIRYLLTHQGNARYLCATPTVRFASAFIIQTGKPIMALGGFLGTDPILTPERLREILQRGELRYFLDTGEYQMPDAAPNDRLQDLFRETCREVPAPQWRDSSTHSSLADCRLWDCKLPASLTPNAQKPKPTRLPP